jgi:alpha-ketoglutarate-dependent 2,4-dichlorophenoxyacetate dioxygenase
MSLSHIHIRTYENTTPPRSEEQRPIQYGTLTVTPILQSRDSAFGAEVSGIDWKNPVPAETVTQVKRARGVEGRGFLTLHIACRASR